MVPGRHREVEYLVAPALGRAGLDRASGSWRLLCSPKSNVPGSFRPSGGRTIEIAGQSIDNTSFDYEGVWRDEGSGCRRGRFQLYRYVCETSSMRYGTEESCAAFRHQQVFAIANVPGGLLPLQELLKNRTI